MIRCHMRLMSAALVRRESAHAFSTFESLVRTSDSRARLAALVSPALDRIGRTHRDDEHLTALRSAWLKLARTFDIDVPTSLPSCSNAGCDGRSMRRFACASCRFSHYCDARCQRDVPALQVDVADAASADWTAVHRSQCDWLRVND